MVQDLQENTQPNTQPGISLFWRVRYHSELIHDRTRIYMHWPEAYHACWYRHIQFASVQPSTKIVISALDITQRCTTYDTGCCQLHQPRAQTQPSHLQPPHQQHIHVHTSSQNSSLLQERSQQNTKSYSARHGWPSLITRPVARPSVCLSVCPLRTLTWTFSRRYNPE